MKLVAMVDQVAEEDGDCREINSELVETSTSQTMSIESDSSTCSGNPAISLLRVLN